MNNKMDSVIDYLEKGLLVNNAEIVAYKESMLISKEDDSDGVILQLSICAIAMLERDNEQMLKAIKILSNQQRGY